MQFLPTLSSLAFLLSTTRMCTRPWVALFWCLLCLCLLSVVINDDDDEKKYKNPLSRGFGDEIDWVSWDNAIETGLTTNKPIFLLIHKKWCHACKSLKKAFQQLSAVKAFTLLSKYFVMVNCEDDEEPWEEEYQPDGKYIPRLLFLDKDGELMDEFTNTKTSYESYKYYYSNPGEVMATMKLVLKKFGIDPPETLKAKSANVGGDKKEKKHEESRVVSKSGKDKTEDENDNIQDDKYETKKDKNKTKDDKVKTKNDKDDNDKAKDDKVKSKKDKNKTKDANDKTKDDTDKERNGKPEAEQPSIKPPAGLKTSDTKKVKKEL